MSQEPNLTFATDRPVEFEAFQTYASQETAAINQALISSTLIPVIFGLVPFIWLIKTAKAGHPTLLPALTLTAVLVLTAAIGLKAFLNYQSKTPLQRQALSTLMRFTNAKSCGGVRIGITVGSSHKLRHSSSSGMPTITLSQEAATLLNEAAKSVLLARSVLESAAWQSVTGTRASIRESARASIDDAMNRTVVLATTSGDTTEVRRLVAELSEVAEELSTSGRRMETLSGEGSFGLRSTLEQLREISKAEKEIFENRTGL